MICHSCQVYERPDKNNGSLKKDKRNSVRNRCQTPWNLPGRNGKKVGVKAPMKKKRKVGKVKKEKKADSVKSKRQQVVKNESKTEGEKNYVKELKDDIKQFRNKISDDVETCARLDSLMPMLDKMNEILQAHARQIRQNETN